MSDAATVRVSPIAYPLPALVTVIPVTVLPLMTTVTTAPVPDPSVVVAKPVRVPSAESVGLSVAPVPMLPTNAFAVVLSTPAPLNPSQY